MKKDLLVFLLVLLFVVALVGCTSNNITANVVAEPSSKIGSLTLIVTSENGSYVSDAEVYVNNKLKGKTKEFGDQKGSRKVILPEEENEIVVKKEGFMPTEPLIINAYKSGEQTVTVILEQRKTNVVVEVVSSKEPVEKARVSLYPLNSTLPVRVIITDSEGVAVIERVDEGDYTITAAKEGYVTDTTQQDVNFTRDEDVLKLLFDLHEEPTLDVSILDIDGNPLAGSEVTLYTKEEYDAPGSWASATKISNEEGKVFFRYIELDVNYVVVVKKSGFSAQVVQKIMSVQDQSLVVEMNS